MNPQIKKLIHEVRPFKRYIIIIALAGIVFGVTYSRLGLIMKDLFDDLTKGQPQKVYDSFLIAISLSLIAAVSRYFHIYLMNYVAEMVVQGMREKLQQKFMRLNLSFHSNYATGSGGLLSRIMNDMKIIQDGLRMIADFFLHPLLLICLIGNLFYLDYRLTLFTMLLLPIIGLFLRTISRSLLKYIPRGQDNMEGMTSIIKESLDGIRIIQSFNLEPYMANKLHVKGKEYLQNRKKVHSRIEVMGPVTEFLASAVVLLILLYTSYEISRGRSTPGAFIGFITSLLMVNQPLKKLQESYVRLQEVLVSAGRIYSILDENSEVPVFENSLPFPKNWKILEYKNVTFSYQDKVILKNFNLQINRGEQIALIGSSGSGKSTIVNLLERFYDPDEGNIFVDGISINKFDLVDLRRNIAMVSQDVFLLNDSIGENIHSGDFSRGKENINTTSIAANADPFIQRLENKYQTIVGERGGRLSGGEKQRISIARAFFKNASILILDEATSALDTTSEIEVQKGLDSLISGKTALIITHRLTTVKNADRILVLDHGKIVEEGKHDFLYNLKGKYYSFLQKEVE